MKTLEYDLIALGGGTAGLVSAAGASYLGLRPALVEKAALGGDCLWTGCIPSKALIASARLAHAMRHAERLGLSGVAPGPAFEEVMDRMRGARDRVAHHDDPERFRKMGVEVHFGAAEFQGPGNVEVEGIGLIRSKRIVLATGAHAAIPPIPGLDKAGYITHATAFDQNELPSSITILGGGPIGLEFAQIYSRLGAAVTVIEMLPQILPREDPDVASSLRRILEEEGIRIHTGVRAVEVKPESGPPGPSGSEVVDREHAGGRPDFDSTPGERGIGGGPGKKVVILEDGGSVEADQIFVATGRRPVTEGLSLEKAGIELSNGAVSVDSALRTTAPGVWAAGDVTGGLQFTHVADYMAKVALQNSLFPFKKRVDYANVPWVTYTDPEVAHVGLGQAEAEARGGTTFSYPFDDLDRAIVDGETHGFVKISADKKGKILGATVLGHMAGELLMPLVLAKQNGLSLPKIAGTIFPYPTRVEGVKRTVDAYQRGRLEGTGGRVLRKVVSWLR